MSSLMYRRSNVQVPALDAAEALAATRLSWFPLQDAVPSRSGVGLRREADAAKQLDKPWIGAKIIERRCHTEKNHPA